MIILIFTFIYWAYSTYENRGEVFYSLHGLFSTLILISFIVSGAFSTSKKDWGQAIHGQAALLGFGMYVLVMFLGLLIAWGSI